MEEDIKIESETVYEFELTDKVSLFYEEKSNCWYAEKTEFDLSDEDTIIIIEDEDFEMEEEIDIFGIPFTKDMLEDYKQIVEEDKGEVE